MMRSISSARFPLLALVLFLFLAKTDAAPFQLKDGDRVAFIGGGLIEREQQDGFIETMFTRSALDRSVTFRNFGWTGDTVDRRTRPVKMPPLEKYLEAFQPTLVVVSFGEMESFNGAPGVAGFAKAYGELLDKLSAKGARIIVLSPTRHENLGGMWPEVNERNKNLKLYVNAIAELAKKRGHTFVNLFDDLKPAKDEKLTVNAVQLSSRGYERAAETIGKELRLRPVAHTSAEPDPLREAIKYKNQQFWYHYKPQNYEYIYGSRVGNQAGLPEEVEQFAKLAAEGDRTIASLRQRIARGERVPLLRPSSKEYYTPVDGTVEEDRKALQVKDGFEVNVFAADPSIQKPVALAWDARGRLWVSTTTVYPQIRPGQQPMDRIIILEDTDHDGRADKTTVFADNLYMPTGLIPVKGGCYVFDEVFMSFLPDADGDDKADGKEILLAGFGAEDNHHKGHTFRWSPDGRIHFQQGIFLHTTVETTYGIRQHLKAGIFQYDPFNGSFETYLANSVPPNPWGHYWNKWGQDFHIDASGQLGSTFIIPTAGPSSAHSLVPGGSAKLAAAEILSGRHFGPEFEGDLIAPPFKENRVAHWKFSEDGSGYALKALDPLIISTNRNFRPVDPRMGPDGALYIADWYNPLIGHMQHHLNDPARDHFRGRIWRITRKGAAALPVVDFTKLSIPEVLEHLKDPEQYNRNMARRVLVEYHPKEKVLAELPRWVKGLNTSETDYDHHRVEALWVYQSLRVPEPSLLKAVLKAADPNARASATMVFRDPYWRAKMSDALELLSERAQDEHPRVRLQAIISLSYLTNPHAIEAAALAVDRPLDRYIEQALKQTAQALQSYWLPVMEKGQLTFGGKENRRNYILQTAGLTGKVGPLISLLLENKIAPSNLDSTLQSIAQEADEEQLFKLQRSSFDPNTLAKVYAAITRAVRERKLAFKPDNNELREKLLGGATDAIVAEAARLGGASKNTYVQKLVADLAETTKSATVRKGAMDGLAYYGGADEIAVLHRLTSTGHEAATRLGAVEALAQVDVKFASIAAADVLAADLAGADPSAVFQAFLARKGGAEALGNILAVRKPTPDAAKIGLRTLQAAGRQEEELTKVLSGAAGLDAEVKPLSKAEMEQWLAEIRQKGDPARGEQVFRRANLSCYQCHAINNAGGQVGPDLSAVGTGSTVDYLLESILFPSKVVKDGFETVEVTTTDDDYILGIKVRENKEELVLKDAARAEIVVPLKSIKERKDKPVSLMPNGLANGLTHAELIDLARFLSELGKPGPYANNTKPVLRRWRTIGSGSAESQPNSSPSDSATSAQHSANSVYTLVSGVLPLEALGNSGGSITRARAEIEVTTPGKILLRVNSTEGLSLDVGSRKVSVNKETILDLPRGIVSITFLINPQLRREGLRVELDEVPGSPGRAQVLAGK